MVIEVKNTDKFFFCTETFVKQNKILYSIAVM